jgi:glucose-6-phosphate 1-dehydrogenase
MKGLFMESTDPKQDTTRGESLVNMIEKPAGPNHPEGRGCEIASGLEPCVLVIMGASGDLTARKLLPSLYRLHTRNLLPEPFVVVGCGRTPMSDDAFRNKMKEALTEHDGMDWTQWDAFASVLYYRSIQYDDLLSYVDLAEDLKNFNELYRIRGNRLFYLAVPPSLYEVVAEMLGQSELAAENEDQSGWSRLVVEKPFGHDLASAVHLDRCLHTYFQENQIFRIDHYLAKETVQNMLMFRFANAIFEPIWNRRYIDYITITAAEKLGVGHRAGYYEQSGVIRDMFQNHMMQLLALVAMEPPALFAADPANDEKAKVFRALRPFPVDRMQEHLILGQYASGVMDGQAVEGYREEKNVDPDSLIPTFAMMKIFVDNWRWQGVPFYLMSGKRLARKATRIDIQFKEVPHSMFRAALGEHIAANRLTLCVYPEEKIMLNFQTKIPGTKVCLRSVTMDYAYYRHAALAVGDAYEKVLIDCILGDHMLFWRQDGVELCWSFLTPILKGCEECQTRAERLYPYPSGSWGPAAAEKWQPYFMTECL